MKVEGKMGGVRGGPVRRILFEMDQFGLWRLLKVEYYFCDLKEILIFIFTSIQIVTTFCSHEDLNISISYVLLNP